MSLVGLFVFEKRIYKDEQGCYYDTVFTNQVLERYTSVVDKLYILARVDVLKISEEEILKKYSIITLPKVTIIEIENVLSISGMFKCNRIKRKLIYYVNKCDVLFLRVPSIWQYQIVKAAEQRNIKYVLESGADAWATYWNTNLKGKLFAPYIELTTRKVIKNSKYTVYVTNNWLQNRYPTNGKYISCSNVDIKIQNEKILDFRKEKIRLIDGKYKIGTLADVANRAKGQRYVIEAIAHLKKEGITNFEYHLAGSGDQSYLKKIIKDNNVEDLVFFDGLIRHDLIGDWFASIDIYVQPSRQDGLPRSLIEAMSFGLPAFGAKTGGIPELLDKEFIFSNSLSNISEICCILKKFSINVMLEQAEINFAEASKYSFEIIENRRHQFFLQMIESK